jgi:nitrogen fixation NifU-like protein
MSSEEQIYQDHILDHYEDPFHRGSCPGATHADEGSNPLCGDVVRIELRIDPQGQIEEGWFEGRGCVVSQASASMLMEKVEGMTRDQARQFSAQQMLDLYGARLTPNRQKCCLLSWKVLQGALHAPRNEELEPTSGPDSGAGFNGPSLSEEQ